MFKKQWPAFVLAFVLPLVAVFWWWGGFSAVSVTETEAGPGNKAGYEMVQPYLEAIAAKDHQQNPCCTYISEGGSGHFVKMIHNGIEYVEMQLLSEVYQVLRQNGKNPDAIAAVFEAWKKEGVDSYLLDITIDILKEKEGDKWLLDQIVDEAQSKGTGNWAAIEITKQHVPATLIATSLYARYESSYKDLRVALNALYPVLHNAESPIAVELLREAYELARIINHFQGEGIRKNNLEIEALQIIKRSLLLKTRSQHSKKADSFLPK